MVKVFILKSIKQVLVSQLFKADIKIHGKDNIFKKLFLTAKTFNIGMKECYLFQNFQRDLPRKG